MTLQALIIHSPAEEDIKLAKRLDAHLSSLRREGNVSFEMAELYEDSAADIKPSVAAADLIVFIISADLVREDAPYDLLTATVARHRAGDVRVMTLYARTVDLGDAVKGVTRFPREKSLLQVACKECESCGHRFDDAESMDGLLVEFCGNIRKTAKEIIKLRGE